MKAITTGRAPRAVGPYSQAVESAGMVFCSGQIGIDPARGELVGTGMKEQATQCLLNLRAVLEAAGLETEDVVKTTVFLIDMNDYAEMNEAYAAFFTARPPARSAVAVSALPRGARVEIEALAVRS